jgi:hypothetical protein
VAQLLTAFTFGGWLPYALWKLSATQAPHQPTPRQQLHPLVGWPILWRVASPGSPASAAGGPRLLVPELLERGEQPLAHGLTIGRVRRELREQLPVHHAEAVVGQARQEVVQRVVAQAHRRDERGQRRPAREVDRVEQLPLAVDGLAGVLVAVGGERAHLVHDHDPGGHDEPLGHHVKRQPAEPHRQRDGPRKRGGPRLLPGPAPYRTPARRRPQVVHVDDQRRAARHHEAAQRGE